MVTVGYRPFLSSCGKKRPNCHAATFAASQQVVNFGSCPFLPDRQKRPSSYRRRKGRNEICRFSLCGQGEQVSLGRGKRRRWPPRGWLALRTHYGNAKRPKTAKQHPTTKAEKLARGKDIQLATHLV
jgi:hypothetical protein